MQIIIKNITDIHPYDKNPRKNDKGVEYVEMIGQMFEGCGEIYKNR